MVIIVFLLLFNLYVNTIVSFELTPRRVLTEISDYADYWLYAYNSAFNPINKTIYFILESESNTLQFNIWYSFKGSNDTSTHNITIYHKEKKGNLNAFFFKVEMPEGNNVRVDFNITNIKGEYKIGSSRYEELNANLLVLKMQQRKIIFKFIKINLY